MDEPDVVIGIAEHLNKQGKSFFVDTSGYDSTDVDDLPDRLEHCKENTIRIGTRLPDVLGYTDQNELFAIEAKGSKKIRKGIGQAAYYRQGVHRSYLAAETKAVEEFEDTARACGLGLFKFDTRSKFDKEDPNDNISATKIDKTRRALAVKTSSFVSSSDAFGSTTQPINAFLPIIYLHDENKLTDSASVKEFREWSDNQEKSLSFKSARHALTLSKTLQLIERTGKDSFTSTNIGQSGYYLLRGRADEQPERSLGIDSTGQNITDKLLTYRQFLIKGRKEKLYEKDTSLSTHLRHQYFSIPDIRVLIRVLSSQSGNTAELSRIMADVATESPDAFLNLFAKRKKGVESEFKQILDDEDWSSEMFREELIDIGSPDALYNFVHQCIHVGLLTHQTDTVHQKADELALDEYWWEWDTDIIGEVGHSSI